MMVFGKDKCQLIKKDETLKALNTEKCPDVIDTEMYKSSVNKTNITFITKKLAEKETLWFKNKSLWKTFHLKHCSQYLNGGILSTAPSQHCWNPQYRARLQTFLSCGIKDVNKIFKSKHWGKKKITENRQLDRTAGMFFFKKEREGRLAEDVHLFHRNVMKLWHKNITVWAERHREDLVFLCCLCWSDGRVCKQEVKAVNTTQLHSFSLEVELFGW